MVDSTIAPEALPSNPEIMSAIAKLESAGYSIVAPRSPDEELAAAWRQILSVLTMACDMAQDGAVLRLTRSPAISPKADVKALSESGIMRMVREILSSAVVVDREGADDQRRARKNAEYRCTGGHDLCYGGTSAGPECPYCERVLPEDR